MGKQGSFIRRFTDIVLSSFFLIITSPLLILSAIAIKVETPGPVFFVHNRTGYKGNDFKMIKFRGMVNNALEIGPDLTQINDPRLTRVGKILRRTSIDELPNFINVLKGDMSIVGPRPEMSSITKNYTDEQREIFNFKPGVTGISQVNGRQTLTPEKRLKMELEYYQGSTYLSDLKILFKTILVVINNDGNV